MDWAGLSGLLVVLGGGVAWLLKWMWDCRKEDLAAIDLRFKQCETERKELISENKRKQEEFEEREKRKEKEHEEDKQKMLQRIAGLEEAIHTQERLEIPCWKHSQDGVILSASKEFIRLFCAPFDYRLTDIVGKKFCDLELFPKELAQVLGRMSNEALARGYSSRSGIAITSQTKATVIKSVATTSLGDLIYIGYAVPEFEN